MIAVMIPAVLNSSIMFSTLCPFTFALVYLASIMICRLSPGWRAREGMPPGTNKVLRLSPWPPLTDGGWEIEIQFLIHEGMRRIENCNCNPMR